MPHDQAEHKSYHPPRVVGSITTLEDWVGLSPRDMSDQCDWLEVRLDTFPRHITARELMETKPLLPVLVTARCTQEGGKRKMEEEERLALLADFVPYAHAIDVEIASMPGARDLIAEAHGKGTLVIASGHDFDKTPDLDDLRRRTRQARDLGADIVKHAFMIKDPTDIVTGIRLLEDSDVPMSVMGMGALGQISRLLYAQLGSCLVYGYLGHYPAAPGQWPAGDFKKVLKLLQHVNGQSLA